MRTPHFCLTVAALATVVVAQGQTKPAMSKQAVKATPPAISRPVLGTAQLPGDDGKLNQAYTMGTQGKLNLVLTGVRYGKSRWIYEGSTVAPDRDHKLMILSFQIQNPNKEITTFNDAALKFTAIDQEGENHEGEGHVIQKNGTKDLNIDLKPAQRIDCESVILVPAKGVVPKLMVAHRSGGGVLRYDLHDAVQGLDKPYSENGTDAAERFAGEAGTYYSLLDSDVKYASTAFQERQLGNNTCDPTKEIYMLSRMTFRMETPGRGFMRFEAEAVDENGDRYPATSIRKASTEDHMASYAESGEETNGRVAFVVPKGVKIAKMRIWETTHGKSSVVEFPVDQYATADGQPLNKGAQAAMPAQTGVSADEYTTTFRKADGSTAMEATHLERTDGGTKTTAITLGGRRALVVEATDGTTLSFPDTGEVLNAPKAQGDEPVTSLSYYAMAYANATAPKPKKKSPFGQLAKSILDGGADNLGQSLMSSDGLSNFGKVAVGQVVENAAQRTLTYQLGRAVMTSTQSVGDGHSSGSVVVDKKTYAETAFKASQTVDPATLKVDASKAQSVDAKVLYKRFAEFMSQGLK